MKKIKITTEIEVPTHDIKDCIFCGAIIYHDLRDDECRYDFPVYWQEGGGFTTTRKRPECCIQAAAKAAGVIE